MLWIKRCIFFVALLPVAMCQAEDEQYKAGVHYEILPQNSKFTRTSLKPDLFYIQIRNRKLKTLFPTRLLPHGLPPLDKHLLDEVSNCPADADA